MNKYGQLAQKHWTEFRPSALAELVYSTIEDQGEDGTDPATFAGINEFHAAIQSALRDDEADFYLP